MNYNWFQTKLNICQLVRDTNFISRRINFKIIYNKNIDSDNEPIIKIIQFPLKFTLNDLKKVFSCFGKIEIVSIPIKQKISERCGYVKFGTFQSIDFAFIYDPLHITQTLLKGSKLQGIKKWLIKYKSLRPNPKKLSSLINQFMDIYDKELKRERKVEQKRKEKEKIQGWILVTSKRGACKINRVNSLVSKNKIKKNSLKKTNAIQERKSSNVRQLDSLRQKFKLDKLKIKRLRMRRKIKCSIS